MNTSATAVKREEVQGAPLNAAPLSLRLRAALEVGSVPLARLLAREIVDRHRGGGRFAPTFRYAIQASVDDLALRFAAAVAARNDHVRFLRPIDDAAALELMQQPSPKTDPKTYQGEWPTSAQIPFLVHIADVRGYRTLAIDLDAKRRDPASVSCSIEDLLRHTDIQFVTCASGPQGGRHILVTWRERIPHAAIWRVVRALANRFPDIDITPLRNWKEGGIRPLLGRHDSWGRSRPVSHTVADALRVLEDGNSAQAWRRLAAELEVPLLSPRMEALLHWGDTKGRYRSRSEVVQAIALGHVNARSTARHLIDDLLDDNNAGGEGARARRPREVVYILRSWRKAQDRAARYPRATARPKDPAAVFPIRAAAGHYAWRGQAGQTDWAVMQAHLALAERLGRAIYHFAVRDVALGAGISQKTAGASHERLKAAGWLRQVGPRRRGQATQWQIQVPDKMTAYDPQEPPVRTYGVNLSDPHHDLWRRHFGLGKGACRTYGLLREVAKPAAELSATLTLTTRGTMRYLRRLEKYGLAEQRTEGWIRGPADPVQVGTTLGAHGAAARDRNQYDMQRQAFRETVPLYHDERLDRRTGEVVRRAQVGKVAGGTMDRTHRSLRGEIMAVAGRRLESRRLRPRSGSHPGTPITDADLAAFIVRIGMRAARP